MSMDYDVFLSYNREDGAVVQGIAASLQERFGLRPWLDVDQAQPGTRLPDVIEKAIRHSRTAAVFVGPKGLGRWQRRELDVLVQRMVERKVPVIPVLLPQRRQKPTLNPFLDTAIWVDLREGVTDLGMAQLVWGITGRKPVSSHGPRPSCLEINNLPYPSLHHLLKGREDELRRLEQSLTGTGKAAAILQSWAIHGLGGIGKTRLAVEYAWRSGNRYHTALFVRADSPEGLSAGMAALAGPEVLHLPRQQVQEEDEAVAAVLRWLWGHPGWLLILDNVDSEEAADAVKQLLPKLAGGHVLITSRLRNWPPEVPRWPLDTIAAPDAVRFLLDRTRDGRDPAADDDEQATRLAEILGGLPLALEQAAAYVVKHQMRLADYLRVWSSERDRLLRWRDGWMTQYPASVAVTWKKSFGRLPPTARALLRLTAFFAPDPILIPMLEAGESHVLAAARLLSRSRKPLQSVPEALADLAAYSLIARQGPTLAVHRIVQEVLRSQISASQARDWIERSLRVLNDYAPDPEDVQTWPAWDLLRPHAARAVEEGERVGITTLTSRLMNRLGLLLLGKGLYAEAEKLLQRALEIDEAASGPRHPDVARDLRAMAQLLNATSRLAEAEPLMRRALEIGEAAFGIGHPDLTRDLHPLAWLLKDTGRLAEAERLMERARAIDEAAFGPDDPRVARDLQNLSWLLKDTGRHAEAEELIERARAIDEAAFGPDDPAVAGDLNRLAWLFKDMGRLAQAEALMRRCLEIDEAALGPYHPDLSRDLRSLAWLLQDLARWAEAETLMRRALEVDRAVFGAEHPYVARDLDSLSWMLRAAGRPAQARPLIEQALEILQKRLGAKHPTTHILRRNLRDFVKSHPAG